MFLTLLPALQVDVTVTLASLNQGVITVPATVVIPRNQTSVWFDFTVLPQAARFTSRDVELTARWAEKVIAWKITVVRPEALRVSPLLIAPKPPENPCTQILIEGSEQEFIIANLDVICRHNNLVYEWSVDGAVPVATDRPVLTIASLPRAGSEVTIKVTVSNADKIHSSGGFTFTTSGKETGLDSLERYG